MVQGQHLGVRYSKKKMQGQEVLAFNEMEHHSDNVQSKTSVLSA